ncbi:MAG: GNAT family N-acetyltransferase [Lachnospiraceae bacterium]|nr:GNAT family N-acetyltransferase [Lachnospiraceae bacterium]
MKSFKHEFLSEISIYKEYRGLGIATAMMKEILTLLQSQGYKQVSSTI